MKRLSSSEIGRGPRGPTSKANAAASIGRVSPSCAVWCESRDFSILSFESDRGFAKRSRRSFNAPRGSRGRHRRGDQRCRGCRQEGRQRSLARRSVERTFGVRRWNGLVAVVGLGWARQPECTQRCARGSRRARHRAAPRVLANSHCLASSWPYSSRLSTFFLRRTQDADDPVPRQARDRRGPENV
jgi:hypothetical protein